MGSSTVKGDAKVIDYLNQVLKNELTAINQYFLHSRMLHDWGVKQLGDKAYKESIEEMEHADALIKRILFLEGLPGMQELGRLRIGEDVKETLDCDLALELEAIPVLRDAIQHSEGARDYVSRDLFKEILDDEEEHVDWLETQMVQIEKMGIQNYVQMMSADDDD